MNKEKLMELLDTLLKLKEKLKCALCLDVIQDVAELECGHKYCNDCYLQYKSTEKKCVCPLCKKIMNRRSIPYKDSFANVLGKFISETSKKVNSIYGCEVEQLQRQLKEHPNKTLKDRPAESRVSFSSNICNPSTSGLQKLMNKKQEDFNDLFDSLRKPCIESFTFNKKGNKKTYVNKTKGAKKTDDAYEILEFEDQEKRQTILKWLNSSQNAFERLTPTQSHHEEQNLSPGIDLESISQLKDGRSRNKEPNICSREVRARSLDIEIRKIVPNVKKRHSDEARSEIVENYNIDEINTEEENIVKKAEENVLLGILEDEYLDKLENEMVNTNLKPKNKKQKSGNICKNSKPSSAEEKHITKMKKTLTTGEKVPKRLNVALQSVHNEKSKRGDYRKESEVSINQTAPWPPDNNIKIDQVGENEDIQEVIEGEMDKKEQTIEVPETRTHCTGKSYDLNQFEHYITLNLKEIKKETILDDDITSNNQFRSSQRHSPHIDQEIAPVLKTRNENEDVEAAYHMCTQRVNHDCANTHNELNKSRNSPTEVLDLLQEIVNRCKLHLSKVNVDMIENQIMMMQFHISKLRSLMDATGVVKDPNCDAETQTVIETANAEVQAVINYHTTTTQTTTSSNTIAVQTEVDNVTVATQTYKTQCTKQPTQDQIPEATAGSRKTQKNSQNEIFTSTFDDLNFDTQEITTNQGIMLRSTQKPTVKDQVQSERKVELETKVDAQKNEFKQVPMATFDNLNFDTQEIIKNKHIMLGSTQKASVKDRVHSERQAEKEMKVDAQKNESKHVPCSVLVCSLVSGTNELKQVDQRLTDGREMGRRYKRIRMPTESDSDEEPEHKRAHNRFIRDDLTVEFQTNTAVFEGSENSENVNYDDYLAQVMKKYETNGLSVVSTPDKPALKEPERSVVKDVIAKCEEMEQAGNDNKNIKEAVDVSSSSKDSFQTASQEVRHDFNDILTEDNVFLNEDNLMKLEKDILDHEKENIGPRDSESTDVISETEEIQPVRKKIKKIDVAQGKLESAGLFDQSDYGGAQKKEDQVCQELNDSFDEAGLEIIDMCCEEQQKRGDVQRQDKAKVNVISDIVLKNQYGKGEEEDLFSDEDIVETTPRKQIASFSERSILSQIDNLPVPGETTHIPLPAPETDHFDLDLAQLPPPPGFRDDTEPQDNAQNDFCDPNAADNDATMVNSIVNSNSLTPDKLSQLLFVRKSSSKVDCELSQSVVPCTPKSKAKINCPTTPEQQDRAKRRLSHSTPVTQRDVERDTLGFSPISHVEKTVSGAQKDPVKPTVTQRDVERDTLGFSPISHLEKTISETQKNPVKPTLNALQLSQQNKTQKREVLDASFSSSSSRQSGIISMAHSARYTPLAVFSKTATHKPNILASVPNQRSIWNYVVPSGSKTPESAAAAKPCIACTKLSKPQVHTIVRLTERGLARFSPTFTPDVTHVIVNANDQNCVEDHTMKYVAAVAAGLWVLNFDWVKDCLRQECIVPEEPYEVLDMSGFPGPKTARLTREKDPLFKGYKFYCADPFLSISKAQVEMIIRLLQGKVLPDMNGLLKDDGNIGLIIAEGRDTEDVEQYERWVEQYRTVTVDIEWLCRCIGQYRMVSLRPYISGSEVNLDNLRYPPQLTEIVPFSFTETF